METFTFKNLLDAYNKGIIGKTGFNKKLYCYIKDLCYAAFQNHVVGEAINGSNINSAMIGSICERVCAAVSKDPSEFFNATTLHNQFNEIDIDNNSYEVFHCLEPKVSLESIKKEGRKISISIGLETGTVFVNIIGTKKDLHNNDEPIVATYALADCSLIIQTEKHGKNYDDYSVTENKVGNSVICNRFDPSHLTTYNSSGYVDENENNHKNDFTKVELDPERELPLYEKYYKNNAPCPHFHFYQKDLCYNVGSNKASFAINIDDLHSYLKDLEAAYNSKVTNNPILQYDLGMPYLDIIEGAIVCDMSDFISKTKSILDKYEGKDKYDGMNLLYDMLEKTRRKDTVGSLTAAAGVLSFVNSTAFSQFDSNEKALMIVANLGNSFTQAADAKVDEKKLIGEIQRESNNED